MVTTENQVQTDIKLKQKPQQTSKENTIKISQNIDPPIQNSEPLQQIFTSRYMKVVAFMLIIGFNIVVLKNSFLLISPSVSLLGDTTMDAWLYGFAITILMVIILFHEENWESMFCPGAITLYFNISVLVLYLGWVDGLLGRDWVLWWMGGLLSFMPAIGLFIMVLMLKR